MARTANRGFAKMGADEQRLKFSFSIYTANGNNSISNIVFKRKLLKRFSSKGKRNFISYAIRAANDVMNSQSIKKQYNKSIDKFLNTFEQKKVKFNQTLVDKKKQPKGYKQALQPTWGSLYDIG